MHFFLILGGLFFWSLALIGLGLVFRWLLTRLKVQLPDLTFGETGFLGFFWLVFIGLILHFFSALTAFYGYLLLALGLAVFFYQLFSRKIKRPRLLFLVVSLPLLIVIISLRTYLSSHGYDGDLYHYQTLLWHRNYALSPGLGLLHSRLAFNSTWLLLSNFLVTPFVWQVGAFLANSLLGCLASLFVLEKIFLPRRKELATQLSNIYLYLVYFVFLFWQFLPEFDYNPMASDYPLIIFLVYLFYLFLEYFSCRSVSSRRPWLNLLILVAAVSLTIKLTVVPFALAVFALFLFQSWHQRRLAISWQFLVFLLLCFACWSLRYLFLSGCWLYPLAVTCLPQLPWALPIKEVTREMKWIMAWNRQSGLPYQEVLSNWQWVGASWWPRMIESAHFISYALLFVTGYTGISLLLVKQGWRRFWQNQQVFQFLLPLSILSVVFWFLLVPDFRFGQGYLLLAALLPWLVLLRSWFKNQPILAIAQWLSQTLIGLTLLLVFIYSLTQILKPPPRLTSSWPRLQKERYEPNRTPRGQSINQPVVRDLCFAAPIPCAPDIRPDLSYFIENQRYHFYRQPLNLCHPGQVVTKYNQ